MWICLIFIALGRLHMITPNLTEDASERSSVSKGLLTLVEGTSSASATPEYSSLTEDLSASPSSSGEPEVTSRSDSAVSVQPTAYTDEVTTDDDVTPPDVTQEDLSFMAAILLENNQLIGAGAVVGDRWVICTAFQIGAFKAPQLRVRVGSQLLPVDRLIVHPLFRGFSMDAVMLKTAEAITSARSIPVAWRLPGMGDSASLLVWVGSEIQEIRADILLVDECQMFYPDFELSDTNICSVTEYDLSFHMTLFGSPLVVKGSLVGHYMGLGEGDKPALFTCLAPLNGWLQLLMNNETEARLAFPLSEEIVD